MVPRVCAAGVHPILEWHRTCPCCVQVFHHLLPSQVVSHCCHHIARCSYPLLPGNSFSTSFILTRPLFSCPCLHLENPSSFLTLPGLAGRLPSRGCRLCPFPLSHYCAFHCQMRLPASNPICDYMLRAWQCEGGRNPSAKSHEDLQG